jgi:hypothetical protein
VQEDRERPVDGGDGEAELLCHAQQVASRGDPANVVPQGAQLCSVHVQRMPQREVYRNSADLFNMRPHRRWEPGERVHDRR